MSGNSMAAGVALGRLDWPSVLQRGLPILAFFLGNMLGFLVLAQVRRWGIRSSFAVVFGLEALFMLAFLLLGTHALQGGVIRPSPSGIFYVCRAADTGDGAPDGDGTTGEWPGRSYYLCDRCAE